MNVLLTPKLERLVQDKVLSGTYNSVSEVICEALRLLPERDNLRKERLEELKSEIAIGIEAADRGELVPAEEVFERLRHAGESPHARASRSPDYGRPPPRTSAPPHYPHR